MRRESFPLLRRKAFRGRPDAPVPAPAHRHDGERREEANLVSSALDGAELKAGGTGLEAQGEEIAASLSPGAAAGGSLPGPIMALVNLGVPRADAWLGGGLRGDGLHEFQAGQKEDMPAALSLALLLAMRPTCGERAAGNSAEVPEPAAAGGATIAVQQAWQGTPAAHTGIEPVPRRAGLLWLRRESEGVPYGPGLADLGLDPAAITILHLADERALLRAALDAVRAGAVGTVMLESVGRQKLLDLTATRRLVLAAAQTRTMVLIVRAEDQPGLSAAHSRWEVRSAPSRLLEANAPGFPVFDLTLLRQRGGREGLHILLEWNRDTATFRESATFREREDEAPLSGDIPAMAADGACADPQDRAA